MDALKHIPDNVNVLKTERGDARLQKTDIFKKLMWFSYPREESWIPLPISRVKEVQKMNREGIIPPDLGEIVEIEIAPARVLDYENVVGQDSLTRLDERNRNKKKNKNRNKNNKPNGGLDGVSPRQEAASTQPLQPAKAQAPRQDGQRPEGANNRHKRFRPHRNNNNPNRPDGNRGDQPGKPQ